MPPYYFQGLRITLPVTPRIFTDEEITDLQGLSRQGKEALNILFGFRCQLEPVQDIGELLAHKVMHGRTNPFETSYPQNLISGIPVGNALNVAAASAGDLTVITPARLPIGLLVRFLSHKKLYMITGAVSFGTDWILNILPELEEDVAAAADGCIITPDIYGYYDRDYELTYQQNTGLVIPTISIREAKERI